MNDEADQHPNSVVEQFTALIYPFQHSITANSPRLVDLSARWQPWWGRLQDDELKSALDDSFFVLPHVRRLLTPEALLVPVAEIQDVITEARGVADLSVNQFVDKLTSKGLTNSVIRLTLKDSQLQEFKQLLFESPDVTVQIETDWIDAVICPQGIGFLVWRIKVVGEAEFSHQDLSEILYWLRNLHPPKIGWALSQWRAAQQQAGSPTFESRDLVDYLLQRMTEVPDTIDDTFADFLSDDGQISRHDLYTATSSGQIYGQVFHEYTYAALRATDNGSQQQEDDGAGFVKPLDRWVYELATCTDTRDPLYQPHRRQSQQIMADHGIELWNNWTGMALHDNVAFVGLLPNDDNAASSKFLLESLPHNVQSDYLYLYLLVLYQRVWLNVSFGDLIHEGTDVDDNWPVIHRIWERFVQFENCYLYSEVTGKPQGNYLYVMFQKSLNVPNLYAELKDQLKTLHDHYDSVVSRRTDRVLFLLAFLAMPISIATSVFGSSLGNPTTQDLWGFFGLLTFLLVFFWLFARFWRFFGRD